MSTIDKDVLDAIQKEQIELGISTEQQMNRTELNFYAELLSQHRELNKNLEKLYQTLNMIGAERLTQYFKEFTTNFKKEEQSIKLKEKIGKSHKKSGKNQTAKV